MHINGPLQQYLTNINVKYIFGDTIEIPKQSYQINNSVINIKKIQASPKGHPHPVGGVGLKRPSSPKVNAKVLGHFLWCWGRGVGSICHPTLICIILKSQMCIFGIYIVCIGLHVCHNQEFESCLWAVKMSARHYFFRVTQHQHTTIN